MKAAVRLTTPLRTLAQSGSLTKSRFAKSPKRASLMSISLYDLSVPTFLQTVNALAGVLDRADEHCAKTGHDPDDFVEVRLIDDMAPFHFQIEAAWHHAVWGLEAAKTGVFAASTLSVFMKLSALALSYAFPRRPMEPTRACSVRSPR